MWQLWCWLRRSPHPRWLPSSLRLTCANTNWAELRPDRKRMPSYHFCSWKIWSLHSGKKTLFNCYQTTSHWCLSLPNQSWKAPKDFSECASDCRSTLLRWYTSLILKCSSVTRYHEPQLPYVELQQVRLITWSFKFIKTKDSDRKSEKQIWKKQLSSQTNASSKLAKKLARMLFCKHGWAWSQLAERITNNRALFVLVSLAAVISVVTQRSSPPTAAHSSSAFLSSNRPIRSRLPFTGNLVFGGNCNEKYDWRAANNYMHVIGSR